MPDESPFHNVSGYLVAVSQTKVKRCPYIFDIIPPVGIYVTYHRFPGFLVVLPLTTIPPGSIDASTCNMLGKIVVNTHETYANLVHTHNTYTYRVSTAIPGFRLSCIADRLQSVPRPQNLRHERHNMYSLNVHPQANHHETTRTLR